MSKLFERAVRDIRRAQAALSMIQDEALPSRIAYVVSPEEYNRLRYEIVSDGDIASYYPDSMRICGMLVLPYGDGK